MQRGRNNLSIVVFLLLHLASMYYHRSSFLSSYFFLLPFSQGVDEESRRLKDRFLRHSHHARGAPFKTLEGIKISQIALKLPIN